MTSWLNMVSATALIISATVSATVFGLLTPTIGFAGRLARSVAKQTETLAIDVLRDQRLKTQKSPKARTVARAVAALEKKQYARVRGLVTSLRSDPVYSDYGYALTAAAYRGEALLNFKSKKYLSTTTAAKKAVAAYFQIEKENPYSPLLRKLGEEIGKTEILLGDAYTRRKHYKNAMESYNRAFQRLQNSKALAEVQADSLDSYARICARNPDELCSAWAQKFIGLHRRDSDEVRSIARHLPAIASRSHPNYPNPNSSKRYRAPDEDEVAFDQAFQNYLDEDYDDAVDAFQKMLDEYPRSSQRYRARYWLGRALNKDGEKEKGNKVLESLVADSPLTYYGMLAAFDADKNIESYIDATLPSVSFTDPFLDPMEVFRIQRAENFLAEGALDLAKQELHDLRPKDDLSSGFLLYLATLNHEAGYHTGSFIILSHLIQRGYEGVFTSHGMRLIFPDAYLALINKISAPLNLDPVLVLSLVKQESAFEASAVSWAGARGLMQLMPATARDMDPKVEKDDLIEAERNVRIGTAYLNRVLKRFNGNAVFALAGYNGGPNAVARWVREGKAKNGMLEFIEQIPYAETRGYVGSIIRNYFWYTKRLKGELWTNLQYFWNVYEKPQLNTPPVDQPANQPIDGPQAPAAPVATDA